MFFKIVYALNINQWNFATVASVEDDTEEKASKRELQSVMFFQTCKFIVK